MNEEIAKILQLLENGKIDAEGAERLIKALREPGAESPSGARAESAATGVSEDTGICPNPFRDIEQLFRTVTRAYRGSLRRHRRFEEWRWHEYRRGRQQERRQRAETQSIADRIRYVAEERAFIDPDSDLSDLDDVARGLLRYELEEEFGIEIPGDDLEGVNSLEGITAYVESRISRPTPPPPPAAPKKPTPPKRPAKRKEDMPAG
jgi:hypothetical protein